MVLASHYVIKNICLILEQEDMDNVNAALDKFSKRYVDDLELHLLYNEFLKYLETRNKEDLVKIKAALVKLMVARKTETSGGSKLWFKNVRPGTVRRVDV